MSYRTLTTVLHRPDLASSALDTAIDLARTWDAHLTILVTGINAVDPAYLYAAGHVPLLVQGMTDAQELTTKMQDALKSRMHAEDIRWDDVVGTVQPGTLGTFVASYARFGDLVVLPKPNKGDAKSDDIAMIEAALFDAHAPVLMMPGTAAPAPAPQTVMVAWDQSPEALRAVRAAMPLLIKAKNVIITIVDPPQHGPERSDPGGQLATLIARHGGKAAISVLSRSEGRVSDVLLTHAQKAGCDMIVMGAYGHSRLRQSILGGTTRRILDQAACPVLLAH